MTMMAFVFLSVVRNNVNVGMGRGYKTLTGSAPKADVLGTEEMWGTLVLTPPR